MTRPIDDCDSYLAMKMFATNVYVCYRYWNSSRGNYDLRFTKSTDYGATWPAGNIKTLDNAGSTGYYISMALVFPNIYVSYYTHNPKKLNFIKSTDGGASWSTPVVIDNTSTSYYSSIAVDGSNVYISYQDDTNKDLKFAKSTDGGTTWAPPQTIPVPTDDVGYHTSICVTSEGYLYVSFLDYTNKDLMFAKSTNAGWTWSVTTADSTGDAGWYTDIVDWDGGTVMISYTTNGILKTAKSSDYGANWTVTTVDSTVSCQYTALARYSNHVFLGYHDLTNEDLKFARSINTGGTW
jgi:hypothetical protein